MESVTVYADDMCRARESTGGISKDLNSDVYRYYTNDLKTEF